MSNSITRTYTFANGGVADGGQIDSEIQNIVNTINNADAGTTPWTVVKTATLQSTSSTILKGTATNDSAAAGNVGEVFRQYVASVNAGDNVFVNIQQIGLTAGDWDVSGVVNMLVSTATLRTPATLIIALSAFSGNTTTDHVDGDNTVNANAQNVTGTSAEIGGCIPCWRVSLSTSTAIYLKALIGFSAGQPVVLGRISARRVR